MRSSRIASAFSVTAAIFQTAVAEPSRRLPTLRVVVEPPGPDIVPIEQSWREGLAFSAQVLEQMAGLSLARPGMFGGPVALRIRGGRTSHVRVSVDGVPVGDATSPDGGFDLAHMSLTGLSHVEIYPGGRPGNPAQIGAAGTVNFVSATPGEGRKIEVAGDYGSFGTWRGHASLSLGDGRFAVARMASDGISAAAGQPEPDGYERTAISANAQWSDPGGTSLGVSLRHLWARADHDGFPPPDFRLADTSELSRRNEFTGNARLNWPLPAIGGGVAATLGYWRIDRKHSASPAAPEPDFRAAGERVYWRQALQARAWPDHDSSLDLEVEHARGADAARTTIGFGCTHIFTPDPHWRLDAGLGVRHDPDRGAAVPLSAALTRAFGAGTRLWFGWRRAVIAPSLYQRGIFLPPATAPAGNLRPENADEIELGFDWKRAGVRLRVVGFGRITTDLLVWRAGRYENITSGEATGAEISLRWRMGEWLSLASHYTFAHARENGAVALNVPSHRGGITLRARRGPARATLSALFVGAHPQFNGPSPGSARLDLIIAARYPAGIEWRLRVENLLDARYEEINGYGTPGIGVHFGVTIGLEAP